MLKDYPIFFNNTEIMPWSRWDESYETIENVYETEAGTDQINIIRNGKLTIEAEFRCHSGWLSTFRSFARLSTLNLKQYDTETEDYKTYTVRIRDFKAQPIEFSDKVSETNGVWDVRFMIKEI